MKTTTPSQRGFSMVEVLVTLVVLTLGLLGLAGLQISTLKMSQAASARSTASQYAYAMLDRIRSRGETNAAAYVGKVGATTPTDTLVKSDLQVFRKQIESAMPSPQAWIYRLANVKDIPVGGDCSQSTLTSSTSGEVFVVCIAWAQGNDSKLGIGDSPTTTPNADQSVWAAAKLW